MSLLLAGATTLSPAYAQAAPGLTWQPVGSMVRDMRQVVCLPDEDLVALAADGGVWRWSEHRWSLVMPPHRGRLGPDSRDEEVLLAAEVRLNEITDSTDVVALDEADGVVEEEVTAAASSFDDSFIQDLQADLETDLRLQQDGVHNGRLFLAADDLWLQRIDGWFTSSDQGRSWTASDARPPRPPQPKRVFAPQEGPWHRVSPHGILSSVDHGDSWQHSPGSPLGTCWSLDAHAPVAACQDGIYRWGVHTHTTSSYSLSSLPLRRQPWERPRRISLRRWLPVVQSTLTWQPGPLLAYARTKGTWRTEDSYWSVQTTLTWQRRSTEGTDALFVAGGELIPSERPSLQGSGTSAVSRRAYRLRRETTALVAAWLARHRQLTEETDASASLHDRISRSLARQEIEANLSIYLDYPPPLP